MKTDAQKLLDVAKILRICERLGESLRGEAEDRNSPKLKSLSGARMREAQSSIIGQAVAVSAIAGRLRKALDRIEEKRVALQRKENKLEAQLDRAVEMEIKIELRD